MSEPYDVPPAGGTGATASLDLSAAPQHQVNSYQGKPVKAPRQIPDRPLPRMGWQKVWYMLMCAFDKPHLIPKLGRKESAILSTAYDEAVAMNLALDEAKRRRAMRSGSIAYLRDLTNQVPNLNFAFWNTKGASATTTTTVIATAVLAEYSRTTTVLIDGNPAAGTCAARYGLNTGDTVTAQQLAQDICDDNEELAHRDFKSQINRARPSANGVRVVSADSIMYEHRRLNGKSMGRVLELMGHNSEYLAVDTGNDIGDVVSRAVAGFADVFIFTANVGVPDSLRKLSTSMETLRNLGFEDKVKHSVVVISNIPPGKKLDDYRMFLNEVSFADEVTRTLEHKFDGQFVGIAHDEYIALDRIVDLDKLDWETLQSYITVACSILQQSPKLRTLNLEGNNPTAPVV